MANEEHLKILKQGVEQWNKWREENGDIKPHLEEANLRGANLSGANLRRAYLRKADLTGADLSYADLNPANLREADLGGANLSGADLRRANLIDANLSDADPIGANLSGANLSGAYLSRAHLIEANLSGANLSGAHLSAANLRRAYLRKANLSGADLRRANLIDANLSGANLSGAELNRAILIDANLSGANLSGADLNRAILFHANLTSADLTDADLSCSGLVETDFTNATITGCRTYGASAWNVTLVGTVQHNLVITKEGEPVVTVDDLEVGQFIYLLLNNTKIRNVINTITSKAVLILGRFSDPQRKSVLDGLKEGLRNFVERKPTSRRVRNAGGEAKKGGLLPIVFDFDRPTDKDYTETVQTLAGMSMFVIVDLTSPKSTPLELEATVKQFKIPYIPIIDISVDPRPFAMLVDSQKSFHWVLPTRNYESKEDLLDGENLKTYIIEPAFAKREQLREAKNQEPEAIRIPKKKLRSGRL